MSWITCPACGLKHSPRPDGLCPRCRSRTGELSSSAPPPLAPPPAFGAPRPFPGGAAAPEQPLPTSAWGGGPPPPMAAGSAVDQITVGTIVNKTFSVWWANLGKFIGSLLLAYVPLALIGVAAAVAAAYTSADGGSAGEPPVQVFVTILPIVVIAALAFAVLVLAQFGGVVYATLQHLAGKRTTVGAMFGVGFRRAWPLFVVGLAGGLLVMLGFIALIVPGVIVALGLSLVYAVVVAERVTAVEAIKRSFALTKGKRGTIMGALFVIMCAMWAASLLGNVATIAARSNQVLAVGGVFLSLALQLALTPLSTVAIAVAYHDLRVAKEGMDTSQLAKVFE